MASYLDGIVAWHRKRLASDGREPAALAKKAVEAAEAAPPRPFEGALTGLPGISVIAEIKRRSPSRGELNPSLDAVHVARDYESGGAACLSVLTDGPHFGGSASDLEAARAATSIPVLRKDFTLSPVDVYDARIMGADAVLLIAAVLTDLELAELIALSADLGMAALVEVHDEDEAARAVASGARLVGVNQRDLRTFEVDSDQARRVAAVLDPLLTTVAESGIRTAEDVAVLARAGFDAVLVGEALVTAPDRRAALQSLTTSPEGARSCG